MALKPTIYKFCISLSDIDRNYYDTLNLTVARHPSENPERMMARVLAFCLNADEALTFTKGLSEPDVPHIWAHTLDGELAVWIDVGEPAVDRIKKATRLTKTVKVYSFNSKSSVWWEQAKDKFFELPASIYRFDPAGMKILAGLAQRTMDCSITISGESAFVAGAAGECEVDWVVLHTP